MRVPGFQKIGNEMKLLSLISQQTPTDMNNFHPDRNYYKPIDKKTNLVKRCVGIPGDSLEIRDGYVFINGQKNVLPDRSKLQFYHYIHSKKGFSTEKLKRHTGKEFERQYVLTTNNDSQYQRLRRWLVSTKYWGS